MKLELEKIVLASRVFEIIFSGYRNRNTDHFIKKNKLGEFEVKL